MPVLQVCPYYSRLVLREPYGKTGKLHWMYVPDANEVIFGCRKGLSQALTEMDQVGMPHQVTSWA